jgi:hypothetical protein
MTPSNQPLTSHRVDAPHQGPDGPIAPQMLIVLESLPAAVASERRRFRVTVATCSGCVLAAVGWAIVTSMVSSEPHDSPSATFPSATSRRITPAPLDTAPFSTAIWKPSPPPSPSIVESPRTPPPPPPPPSAPFRISLLAVELGSNGHHRAVIYDSALDTVSVISVGDTADGSTLAQIRANGVVFADASGRSQTLLLSEAAIAHEAPRPSRRRGGRAQ